MPDRDEHQGLNPLGGPLDPLAMIHMDLRLFRREIVEAIARLATREDVAHAERRQDERLDDHRRRTDEKMADLGSDLVAEVTARVEAVAAARAAAKEDAELAAAAATRKLEEQQKVTRRWVIGAVCVPIGLFAAAFLQQFAAVSP